MFWLCMIHVARTLWKAGLWSDPKWQTSICTVYDHQIHGVYIYHCCISCGNCSVHSPATIQGKLYLITWKWSKLTTVAAAGHEDMALSSEINTIIAYILFYATSTVSKSDRHHSGSVSGSAHIFSISWVRKSCPVIILLTSSQYV